MGDWAILEITDGTDAGTVSLLSSAVGFNLSSQAPLVTSIGTSLGVHLKDWRPAIAQPKGGGVWQDSPLSSLRQNVHSVLATSNEVFNLKINGEDQNSLIFVVQEFLRLLLLARDYWKTDWQNTIVYLKAQAKCETNPRFADIRGFTIQELENPYGELFFNTMLIAAMDNITLGIERGHLGANIPGTGVATVADGKQSWRFNDKWAVYSDLAAVPDLPSPANAYSAVQAVGNTTIIIGGNDAGGGDDIYVSADQTATWAASVGGGATSIYDFLKIADNNILASDDLNGDRILLTTNQGISFSVLSTQVGGGPLLRLLDESILTGYNGDDVYRSVDNGVSWSIQGTIGTTGTIRALKQSPTIGTIIALVAHVSPSVPRAQIYRSVDNGITWSLVFTPGGSESLSGGSDTGPQILEVDNNGVFYQVIHSGTNRLLKSINDGITWAELNPDILSLVYLVFIDSLGDLYVASDSGGGGNTRIYRSTDGGVNLAQEFQTGGEFFPHDMTESDDGDYYIPGTDFGGVIGGLIFSINDAQDFGGSSTDRMEAANKHNIAQLTHIFVDDGGAFGANLFPITAAFDLYPAVPAANDAIYFGIDTDLIDSGPFASLRFNISIPLSITGAGGAITIVWEYFDGVWKTLDVTDNTAGIDAFDQVGINSIHWEQPGEWETTTVNGVTGYWVRARISALGGTVSPPNHANADIFTVIVPFVEIAASGIEGDLPAIIRSRATNRSDADGRGGSPPNLWCNRAIMGLKTFSRGNRFTAYLNASDEQNPSGMTVTLGSNTSFVTDASITTGRRVDFNPAGSEEMATRITFSLGPTIARDFYGRYHAFLRGQRAGGAVTDFTVRLQISTGSGGILFTSENKQFQTSTAWELIDFGQVAIPASGLLKTTELGDETNLIIQASSVIGIYVPDVSIYDLLLIPTDEWAIDAVDGANNDDSIIGLDDLNPKYLDVDSLTFPKRKIRSLVRVDGTDLVTSIYRPITNGPAILQANAQQRLWFLAAQTDQTGADFNWISPPEITHSVQLFHNAQYLGFRGAR